MISAQGDWQKTVGAMLDSPQKFTNLAEAFVSRVLLRNDSAAGAIIEDVMSAAMCATQQRTLQAPSEALG